MRSDGVPAGLQLGQALVVLDNRAIPLQPVCIAVLERREGEGGREGGRKGMRKESGREEEGGMEGWREERRDGGREGGRE